MSALIHPLTSLQAPVVLLTSRSSLFCATFITTNINIHDRRPPFSLTYGVNLPSSLTTHYSYALVHLHQSTCVGLQYGRKYFYESPKTIKVRSFSWELNTTNRFSEDHLCITTRFQLLIKVAIALPDLPERTNLLLTPQTNEGLAFSNTTLHREILVVREY